MNVFQVVEKISIKTSQADVAKMKDINARMQQALKTGDADAGFMAGAELGDILQNKLYPDLLAVSAYIVNELEKGCAKYSKKDPKWNQACKELPQTKMAILKQIHGQGLKPFQGSKKSGEKIVNIFGKSYIVPAGASKQNVGEEDDPFIKSIDNSFGKGPVARQIGFSPTGELYKAIYRAIKAVMPEADEAEVKKAAKSATDSMQESIGEDMNAIIAKKGKEKHGEKYMDAARSMAQQKGRKLTPDERDRLRNKHSDNRKKANETVAGDVGSIAQSMNKGNMVRRNIYNADGTMKNGLDFGNLLGGSSKPKKAKKRRV